MVLHVRIKASWFIKNIIVRIWREMYREQNIIIQNTGRLNKSALCSRRFLTIGGAYEEKELVLFF